MLLPNLPSVTSEHVETLFHNVNYNQRQCTLLDLIIDLFKVRPHPYTLAFEISGLNVFVVTFIF